MRSLETLVILKKIKIVVLAAALLSIPAGVSQAALSFFVEPNNPWPGGWRNAAVNNMQTLVNMYNAYGDFGNGSIYVYYNAGIPTAQSGYGGWGASIGVGGTYPDVRVLLHESSHWLGTGTYSAAWGGPATTALMEQFEGVGAHLNGDGQHYWPYGENYGNESSPINDRRHVALVYALRKDFGIGSTARPSSATVVTLNGNNPAGESGFNTPWQWNDNHFAQPGTRYTTGNFALRTPNGFPSWTFVGDALIVNNRLNPNGGLLFNGYGNTGVVTFKNLTLDGGTVKHDQFAQDLFQLAGKMTVVSPSSIIPANGNIDVLSDIAGGTTLTIGPSGRQYHVRFLSGRNTFKGNLDVVGNFSLVDNANLDFLILGNHVNNAITGATAVSVALDGDFKLDLSGASAMSGDSWSLVTASHTTYGRDFTVSGFTRTTPGIWTNSTGYSFSQATGALTYILPEPSSVAFIGMAGLGLLSGRRRPVRRGPMK